LSPRKLETWQVMSLGRESNRRIPAPLGSELANSDKLQPVTARTVSGCRLQSPKTGVRISRNTFPPALHPDDNPKTTSPLPNPSSLSPSNCRIINISSIHTVFPTVQRFMEGAEKGGKSERGSPPLQGDPRGCVRFLFVGSLTPDCA